MIRNTILVLVATVCILCIAPRALAQSDQRTSKCSDCKCELRRVGNDYECCCPKCRKHKLKHPPGTPCRMCEREAAEAAAKEQAKREKEQAERDAEQKAYWDKVERDRAAREKKQAERDAEQKAYWDKVERDRAAQEEKNAKEQKAQEDANKTWWDNFKKQNDDYWKKFNGGAKPALPVDPAQTGAGAGPRRPSPRIPVWQPLPEDDDPYWYQDEIDRQRDLYGGRGGDYEQEEQPWWYGISGTGSADGGDGGNGPGGTGGGNFGGVPTTPFPFIRPAPRPYHEPTPEELEAERKAAEERAAAARRAEAKANSDAMREMLGDGGGDSPVRSAAQRNADAMREMLGDVDGDAPVPSLSDLLSIGPDDFGVNNTGTRENSAASARSEAQRNADAMREMLGDGGDDRASSLDDLISAKSDFVSLPVLPDVPTPPASSAGRKFADQAERNQARRDEVSAWAKSQGLADPHRHEKTAAEIASAVFDIGVRGGTTFGNIVNAVYGSPVRGVYDTDSGKILIEGIDALGTAETAVEGKVAAPPLWQKVSRATSIYEVGDELTSAISDISRLANQETAVETTGRVVKLLALGQRLSDRASQLENEVSLLVAVTDQSETVRKAIDSRRLIAARIRVEALPMISEQLDREPSAVRDMAEQRLGISRVRWRR